MPPRPPLRVRRALPLALALAILCPTTAPVASASPATAAELAEARARIDRTSAELAQARTRAERLGGDELEALERVERRLQAQKDALLALEAGLSARLAEDRPATEHEPAEPSASPDAESSDEALVVLADPPRGAATGDAGQRAQELVPAVRGDDAETARLIDGYLASNASPLTGLGAVFVAESRAVGLDPRFLVAVSGAETSFGTYGPSQTIHNPFGMGPGIVYGSWSESIGAAARNLGGSIYLGDGRVTIGAIQQRWAPAGASNDPTDLNSNWARNVATYYTQLGGDPLGAVFTGSSASAAPVASGLAKQMTVVASPLGLPVAVPELGRSGRGPAAAQEALSALGAAWARGGGDPADGVDDVGLVRWAYDAQGVELPRSRTGLADTGLAIRPQDLAAGDAVFFSDQSGTIVNVGLYVGAGQFVHSPGDGASVRISSLYEPFYATSYAGARRY